MRMNHSKEGVQGLVATFDAFDSDEGRADGQRWLNLTDLEIFGYKEKVRDVWVSV